eukprot:CAMPEP_0178955386 /NCGR_PEP_ID=MMETSP0789-20121207/9572_1 /TAXON_ID=3005 /ORGANISM="Rhizosolenia setigera, Strain CCMP 1694" /LENGTH=545 /DNA_ID=CAMNT_0020637003 /DNA_START=1909 /DNA_END=3546 /DNA_ORIENTATION=+
MRYISTLINLFAFSSLLHVNDAHDGSRRISLSHPEDVGLGHTQIISNLQESIRASTPNNAKQFLQALATEMINTICEPHDQDCHQLMIHTTLSTVPHYTDHMQHITSILPDGFDSHVLSSLDRLFSTVSSMTSDTHESTVQMIDRDLHDLKHSEIVEEELHRDIGIMAYSVGLESMKQWREVLDDEDNPFHRMRRKRSRNLQFLPGDTADPDAVDEGSRFDTQFASVVQADIVGAVDGAITGMLGSDTTMNAALAKASTSSTKAFMVSFVDDALGIGGDLLGDTGGNSVAGDLIGFAGNVNDFMGGFSGGGSSSGSGGGDGGLGNHLLDMMGDDGWAPNSETTGSSSNGGGLDFGSLMNEAETLFGGFAGIAAANSGSGGSSTQTNTNNAVPQPETNSNVVTSVPPPPPPPPIVSNSVIEPEPEPQVVTVEENNSDESLLNDVGSFFGGFGGMAEMGSNAISGVDAEIPINPAGFFNDQQDNNSGDDTITISDPDVGGDEGTISTLGASESGGGTEEIINSISTVGCGFFSSNPLCARKSGHMNP